LNHKRRRADEALRRFVFCLQEHLKKKNEFFLSKSVTEVKTDDIIVSSDVKNSFQLFHKHGGST